MALDALKDPLRVPKIVDQVRADDVVEPGSQVEAMGIGDVKLQVGMADTRPLDHGRREVDPHTQGRPAHRQQVALAAADFQHPPAGRDQKAVEGRQPRLVAGASPLPALECARKLFPILNPPPRVLRLRHSPALNRTTR